MIDKANPSEQTNSSPQYSSVIPEVYQVHLEEFQFLWWQWQNAMRSPDFLEADLQPLANRARAHMDGLLIPGPPAIPVLEEKLLAAEDADAAFAASWVLLKLGDAEASDVILNFLPEASEVQLDGICQALSHVPNERLIGPLQQLFLDAPPPVAVIAGESLAFQGELETTSRRIAELLDDESPWVRSHAWRMVSLLGQLSIESMI